jgi:hypothetical protein
MRILRGVSKQIALKTTEVLVTKALEINDSTRFIDKNVHCP